MRYLAVGFILSMSLFINTSSQEPVKGLDGEWKILKEQSYIKFKISSYWLFNVSGKFKDVSGDFTLSDKSQSIKLDVLIKSESLETGNDKRDDHLKSDDFFDVKKYPDIHYSAKKIAQGKSADDFLITGLLTIKDVTKTKEIQVTFKGFVEDDINKAIFEGNTEVNRMDFNVDFTGMPIDETANLKFYIVAKRL